MSDYTSATCLGAGFREILSVEASILRGRC